MNLIMFLIFLPSILARRKICLGICALEVCLQRLLSDLGHGSVVVNRSAKLAGQTINSTILSMFLRTNRSWYLGEGRWISFVLRDEDPSIYFSRFRPAIYVKLKRSPREERPEWKKARLISSGEGRPSRRQGELYNKSTHVYTHTIPFTLTVTMFSLSFFVQFRPP